MDTFLDFEVARNCIRGLHIKNKSQWFKLVRLNKLPKSIPSDPYFVYRKKGWKNYRNWLGNKEVSKIKNCIINNSKEREKKMAKNETPEEKFKRLGEYRVRNALNELRLVGNMSNKSVYKYTDEQKRKIIKVLSEALTEVKHRFENGEIKDKNKFSL